MKLNKVEGWLAAVFGSKGVGKSSMATAWWGRGLCTLDKQAPTVFTRVLPQ